MVPVRALWSKYLRGNRQVCRMDSPTAKSVQTQPAAQCQAFQSRRAGCAQLLQARQAAQLSRDGAGEGVDAQVPEGQPTSASHGLSHRQKPANAAHGAVPSMLELGERAAHRTVTRPLLQLIRPAPQPQ